MRRDKGKKRTKRGIALVLAGILALPSSAYAMESEENLVTPMLEEEESAEGISLDENTFPDEMLREALGELADEDCNGILEEAEYTKVISLDLAHRELRSLKGLEIFPNLEELDCSWNHLTREEVEPFLGLKKIIYYNNTSLVETKEEEVLETMLLTQETPWPEETSKEEEMKEPEETFEEEEVKEPEEAFEEEEVKEPEVIFEEEEAKEPGVISEEEEAKEPEVISEGEEVKEAQTIPEIEEVKEPTVPVVEEVISEEEEEPQPQTDAFSEEEDTKEDAPWRFTFLSIVSSEEIREVPLDEEHFPDVVFRGFLGDTYDRDEDLILSEEEIQSITSLYLCGRDIKDLTGIGYFKNLLLLDATANQLEQLITEELSELRGLYCRENLLSFLDLTHNQELLQLECDENVEITGFEDRGRPESKYGALTEKTKSASVGKSAITKISNPSKGKLKVTYKKVSEARGYEIQLSKDKNFKSSVRKFTAASTSCEISRLYDEWVYYVRVRAYKMDGNRKVYGAFSAVKSHRVKNGLLIVKPSVKAAPIKSVSLISKKTVRVKATAPNVVRSEDKYYYLFNMTPTESKLPPTRKPIAKKTKTTNVTFDVPVKYDTESSRLFYQYAVGVRTGKNKYQLVSGMEFISNPEALAISHRSFPKSSTKKGLQVNEFYISDAVKLGVKHTTYNMCLDDMIAKDSQKNNAQGIPFSYNGKTYWFNRGIIESYDARLNTYKKNNMIVSAIILLRYRPDLTYLMPSGYYQSGFYGLNVTKKQAREHLEAVFTFLARRYATDGRIANWIIGNEVNNYTTYHYTGSKSLAKNAKIYADSFRVAYIAIRSVYSKARLYISLDHLWNTVTSTGHASKAFLNKFAANWDSYGNFNIAYHPYPSPLTAPEFWKNTNNQINNSSNSPCVNMGNLQVLTNYVKSKFGSSTRIILSEQGFTSYKYGSTVEKTQAAAIAYAYYLAEFNNMIDAFILHRHIDHQAEINQGLALGLWSNKAGTVETPGKKKYAWEVYKYADTKKGADKTAFALPIIGKGSWKMAVPGYDPSRFL